MPTPALLRNDVAHVTDQASQAFRRLLAGVPRGDILDVLHDELPGLILLYGETAAVLAAEWYDEARLAAGARGSFTANPADLPDVGIDKLLGWAADTADSLPSMLTLIEGGATKRIVNGSRLTVMRSANRDPQALGTQRYARTSGSCSFCKMLAGRGAVYRSEDTASFVAHDHCHCVAVPAFSGAPLPVTPQAH